MKQIMIVLILIIFSCKSAEKVVEETVKSDVLVFYSKGPCLRKCPVYDLWIHTDGTLVYTKINKIGKKGEVRTKLSSEQLEALQAALAEEDFEVASFKRIRDLPVTRLKHGMKDHKYYVSKIDGPLKKVNSLIESIVNSIT